MPLPAAEHDAIAFGDRCGSGGDVEGGVWRIGIEGEIMVKDIRWAGTECGGLMGVRCYSQSIYRE